MGLRSSRPDSIVVPRGQAACPEGSAASRSKTRSRSSAWSVGALFLLAAVGLGVAGCSSGLKDPVQAMAGGDGIEASPNTRVGFDPGVNIGTPECVSVAGAVIPLDHDGDPATELVETSFALLAFSSDVDSSILSRDGEPDNNGGSDVFFALVGSDVDKTTFMQTLANKIQHPRCITCHMMNSPDSTAFKNPGSLHADGSAALQPPMNDLGNGRCLECHEVPDWRAPGDELDFRDKTQRELFEQVLDSFQDDPDAILDHLIDDPRTAWATGGLPLSGFLPFGNVADDDHDGTPEATDVDGTPRLPNGGRRDDFVKISQDWTDNLRRNLGTDREAAFRDPRVVRDIVLVTRLQDGSASGDGISRSPSLTFTKNPNFEIQDPTQPREFGRLIVSFTSEATDLMSLDGDALNDDTNGVADIYCFSAVLMVAANSTGVSLEHPPNNRVRVSLADGGTTEVSDPSDYSSISQDGRRFTFESLSPDLVPGFGQQNQNDEPDVFLRDLDTITTTLISASTAGASTGGNGGSYRPVFSVDAASAGIAFESDASDLVAADTNGVRDVFYTVLSNPGLMRGSVATGETQGSGGDSRRPSLFVQDAAAGDVWLAFESDKTDLDAPLPLGTTQAYLHGRLGGSVSVRHLNQADIPGNQRLGSRGNGSGTANSYQPVISPSGTQLLFTSEADNIDVLRPRDENDAADVMLLGLNQFASGLISPARISVDADGRDGFGASGSTGPGMGAVSFGVLSGSTAFPSGIATFSTEAMNLGITDNSSEVLLFLAESVGPLANFSATPTSGQPDLVVQFTDLSSDDPTSWSWDFGDGETSTEQNPSHTYTANGQYDVSLSVDGPAGAASLTRQAFITVFDGPPMADFMADVQTGEVALSVSFTDLSDPPATEWSWDFGDGGTSPDQNPTYSYRTAGTYDVSLTSTNASGSSTETKLSFVVVDPTTLDRLFTEVISPRCASCHVNGGTQPPVLDSKAAMLARRNDPNPCPPPNDLDYVEPGDSVASYLYQIVIDGGQRCHLRMPIGTPLTDDQVAQLASWIDDGAQDN